MQTDRLLMRRWHPEDRAPFAAMNADPAVMRYFPAPMDRAASDALFDRLGARLGRDGRGLWALELRADGRFVGFTGLNPMPAWSPGAGELEIGWRLATAYWGRGLATEAACAARDLAFDRLGRRQLWSLTAALNEPSIALMCRIGLRYHGELGHPDIPVGHRLHRHVFYRADAPGAPPMGGA